VTKLPLSTLFEILASGGERRARLFLKQVQFFFRFELYFWFVSVLQLAGKQLVEREGFINFRSGNQMV
jgi:hypothetical protein